MIEIKSIFKRYISKKQETMVLNDISLKINRGEFISIMGPSGSGKSTLLNIIGGLDREYDGEILVHGKKISEFSENEIDD